MPPQDANPTPSFGGFGLRHTLNLLGSNLSKLSSEQQALVDEAAEAVQVMAQLLSVLPDRDWNKFVRWIRLQRVGTQLKGLKILVPSKLLLPGPVTGSMDKAIAFLEGIQGEDPDRGSNQGKDIPEFAGGCGRTAPQRLAS